MTVRVVTERDGIIFDDATSWHIDDHRQLHLRGNEKGNIASFATGQWESVEWYPRSGMGKAPGPE